jgi:hypothetical protein
VMAVADAVGDDACPRLGDFLDRHRHAQNRGLEGDLSLGFGMVKAYAASATRAGRPVSG